jgi:hypothetical protein
MFGSVLEHFVNLLLVKRCKTCVSVLNAVFGRTEVLKMVLDQMHQFYSIAQKMMLWIVFEQLKNLRNVKRQKTFVSGVNALFRGTEIVKIIFHQMH